MNCRKCGSAIRTGLNFCTICGTPVEAEKPQPPAPVESASAPPAPSCSKCGTPLKPGLHFCTACGARVELSSTPEARRDDKTAEVPQITPKPIEDIYEAPTAEMVTRTVEDKPKSVEIPSQIKHVANGPRCPECGAAMMPTSRFCFACGARVQPKKADPPAPTVARAAEGAKEPKAGASAKAIPPLPSPEPVRPARPAVETKASLEEKPARVSGGRSAAKDVEPAPASQPIENVPVKPAAVEAKGQPAVKKTEPVGGTGVHPASASGSKGEAVAAPPAPEPPAMEPKPAPAPTVSDASVCARCGARLKPGMRFCTTCGATVAALPDPIPKATEAAAKEAQPSEKVAMKDGAPVEAQARTEEPIKEKEKVESAAATPATPVEERNTAATAAAPAGGVCLRCGARLKPGVGFCTVCGAVLAPQAEEAPADTEAVATEAKPPEAAARISEPPAEAAIKPEDPIAKTEEPPAVASEARAKKPKTAARAPASDVCATCGSKLRPGVRFCTICGAAAPSETKKDSLGVKGAGTGAEVSKELSEKAEPSAEATLSADESADETAESAVPASAAPVDVPETAPVAAASTAAVCVRCGAPLSPGVRFCIGCGAPAEVPAESTGARSGAAAAAAEPAPATAAVPVDVTEAAPAAAAASSAGVCIRCGAPTTPGVRFCIGCGAPVEQQADGAAGVSAVPRSRPESAAPAPSSPSKTTPKPIQRKGLSAGVLVAIFLVLLAVVAGLAFWLLRSFQYSPLTEVSVAEIASETEGSSAGLPGGNAPDSGLAVEDGVQPSGTAASGLDTSPAQNTPANDPSSSSGPTGSAATAQTASVSPRNPLSAAAPSPAPRKSSPAPTAATNAAQNAQNTAPTPQRSVPFVDEPAPSTTARPAAAPARGTSPSPPPTTAATPAVPTPVQPVAPAAPSEGIIYWSGRLQKNKRFIISTKGTDYGFADGKLLPGTPVEVRVPSPAVKVVEKPGPGNNWQRLILECTRDTNQSVTVNVQWFAAR